jgi:hypothetical protein
MPLLALWQANPKAIAEMTIEQLVATAGDGRLRDKSDCSRELREYLSQAQGDWLASYAEYCLTSAFNRGGMVLQDLVNEMGRRLDFKVTNGRYQGTTGEIGFDGLWKGPEGNDLIVEVKTTDAYRISLDTIAGYCTRLQEQGTVGKNASILLVVGREDTGELEAQVRGSRHAWDMRLISVDALVSLVKLKETTEASATGAKIRSVLVPMEYTKLDSLIDVIFSAAKDVETGGGIEAPVEPDREGEETSGWEFTDSKALDAKREAVVLALGSRDGKRLVKKSRAVYWDAEHTYRAVCTISKRYEKKGSVPYWYAYHPGWDAFLGEAQQGYFVLGCMDLDQAFALPVSVLREHLDVLNTTTKPDGTIYWHIKIVEPGVNQFALQLPKSGKSLPLEPFTLALKTEGSAR